MELPDRLLGLRSEFSFANLDLCNPDGVTYGASLSSSGGFFTKASSATPLDYGAYTAYPGLLNAHDHLLGTWLPKVGRGPYLNWKPWDDDLKLSDLYKERSLVSREDLYLLGSYRQLLSGVTFVSDHIPHVVNDDVIDLCDVRILKQYALSHEASSYDLNWGDGLKEEIQKSKQQKIPYICHIEEGYDKEALRGTEILDSHGGLNRRSVLIHCVSCSRKDIQLMARKKANMVWCPVSNMYMFGDTARVDWFLREGVNVSLGTDSPMSGGLNLFEEMRFARQLYKKRFGKAIPDQLLFQMVTVNPAKAFGLWKELGSLAAGKRADLVLLRKTKKDPYRRLVEATTSDLELVVRDGVPMVVREPHRGLIADESAYEQVEIDGRGFFLIGSPKKLRDRIHSKVGFKKSFGFFPIN